MSEKNPIDIMPQAGMSPENIITKEFKTVDKEGNDTTYTVQKNKDGRVMKITESVKYPFFRHIVSRDFSIKSVD